MEPGTQSADAFTAFQSAETLRKQPNDTGLDAAIEKYKQAVELDPDYAVAHAKLAVAYGRLYGIRRDPAALELARGNSEHALSLDANLVDAHFARAFLLEQTGNVQAALDETKKTLALDPSNPKSVLWQARFYTRLNRWPEAEQAFTGSCRSGLTRGSLITTWVLHYTRRASTGEALQAFAAASVAAPGSSLALSNLGVEYLQIGDFTKATECLKEAWLCSLTSTKRQ